MLKGIKSLEQAKEDEKNMLMTWKYAEQLADKMPKSMDNVFETFKSMSAMYPKYAFVQHILKEHGVEINDYLAICISILADDRPEPATQMLAQLLINLNEVWYDRKGLPRGYKVTPEAYEETFRNLYCDFPYILDKAFEDEYALAWAMQYLPEPPEGEDSNIALEHEAFWKSLTEEGLKEMGGTNYYNNDEEDWTWRKEVM